MIIVCQTCNICKFRLKRYPNLPKRIKKELENDFEDWSSSCVCPNLDDPQFNVVHTICRMCEAPDSSLDIKECECGGC